MTVAIYKSGDVRVSVEGQSTQSGQWGSSGYSVSGLRFFVERGNNAIIVTQANDSSNRAAYKYSGSSGWAPPGSGGGWGGSGSTNDDLAPDYIRGSHKNGKNNYYGAKIDLTVDSHGNANAVVRYSDGRVQYQSGYYRDGNLYLDSTRFRTYRSSGGFTIEEVNNSRNKTVWGGDGWGGGSWNPDNSAGDAPSWIVGEFDGHNRYYNADINLTVRKDGYAVADVRFADGRRQTQVGNYRNGRLTLSGVGFKVSQSGNGFSTEQLGNSANWMEYRRHGSGGWGWDNDQYDNPPSWAIGTFSGYNNLYDADVEVHISSNGTITVDVLFKDGRRQKQKGGYKNGGATIDGIRFDVLSASNGITLRQSNDHQNKTVYRRVW